MCEAENSPARTFFDVEVSTRIVLGACLKHGPVGGLICCARQFVQDARRKVSGPGRGGQGQQQGGEGAAHELMRRVRTSGEASFAEAARVLFFRP